MLAAAGSSLFITHTYGTVCVNVALSLFCHLVSFPSLFPLLISLQLPPSSFVSSTYLCALFLISTALWFSPYRLLQASSSPRGGSHS
ncbi:hypothetical protein CesoFtcFv8_026235 [Champsocephalus esox]|uniref:Uncharacterized protein n=1 Tax=Champsocephalus esox TaxID=159716 RepID=A0AAN8B2D6_9TELE|nr:hypothetical protein CesoFtcFv8_026235 [Champsocephalus esox]